MMNEQFGFYNPATDFSNPEWLELLSPGEGSGTSFQNTGSHCTLTGPLMHVGGKQTSSYFHEAKKESHLGIRGTATCALRIST